MYLRGFVNSAFETSRPTGNLELVDLSLEKKYHPPELPVAKRKEDSNGHSQSSRMINVNGNGTHTKIENANNTNSSNSSNNSNNSNNGATMKRVARKPSRRPSLEDLPADLYMEPLPPLLSKSPSKARHRSSWVPEEPPVNWLQSGRHELEQEWWPFCIGNPNKHIRRKPPTNSWTSTFESVFADGGISIRVQHHPLESSNTEEEEDEDEDEDASQASETRDSISVSPEFCEEIAEEANVSDPSDEGFPRMSQHLERVENDEPGELPSTQTEAKSALSSQELGIEQPEVQDLKGVPIAAPPRSSKLGEEALADLAKLPSLSPSLSSPVMEKMEALAASSESTYSWIQPKLAKTGVQRELPERGLRYSMPKDIDLIQEELSFRLWECEETPKRRESQDERDSARNGFSTLNGVGDDEILKKQSPPNVDAPVNLRTLGVRSRRRGAATTPSKVIPSKVEVDSEQDYPSPSSFTCGLSPTSLFSDDQEPFRSSISSSDDNTFSSFQPVRSRGGSRDETRNGFRKSPRSVLSQEPDEISCETSDSSETLGKKHHQKHHQQTAPAFTPYLYNDESSDLDSPLHAKFRHQLQHPFPAFTYSVGKDMGVTSASSSSSSSEADEGESAVAGSLQELGFFQEANDWEPWLVHDGGVLYDSEDLEFLVSPDSKWKDTTKILPVPEEASSLRSLQLRIGFPSLIQSPTSEEMVESTDGKPKHGSPRIKHDSPKTKLDSLQTKHGSPKTKLDSLQTKHDSPKTELESLKTKHGSPRTKHDSPKSKLDSLKTKHDSPRTELESLKTKHGSPRTKHDSPKTNLDSLKTKHDSPKTKRDSLKTKHDRLKTELESLKTKHDSPKSELEIPKSRHDSPKTQQESPKIKHDSPKTKHDSPKTKHDNLKTPQESPKIKHDGLRRSTSEKKWVPYVTSSLHGNNPPRVRNPTRGGSQPDNPNFDKTPYQGKAFLTKSSTDKTPRRTVNFAPDLVKEIPYSQSEIPATATATQDHRKQQQQSRANPNVQKKTKQEAAADMDPFVAPPPSKVKSKTWEAAEAEVEEEGPSIMNTRRRWRRNRDGGEQDSKANNKSSSLGGGGGSTSWSFSESRFFRNRERVGVPSCVGRLISWPRRFAVKVKSSSRHLDSSDDDEYGDGGGGGERSFAGDRSFGNSSRRDAELVRRILKGSHKKYSNLTGEDILKEDFERLYPQ